MTVRESIPFTILAPSSCYRHSSSCSLLGEGKRRGGSSLGASWDACSSSEEALVVPSLLNNEQSNMEAANFLKVVL